MVYEQVFFKKNMTSKSVLSYEKRMVTDMIRGGEFSTRLRIVSRKQIYTVKPIFKTT